MSKQLMDQIAQYAQDLGHTEAAIQQWQATWTACLQATQIDGLCGTLHALPYGMEQAQEFVAVGETCPQCGGWASSYSTVMPVWQAIAAQLGHLWATQSSIEWTPQSVTETAYLQNSLRRFGEWGYNPPLKYEYFSSLLLKHESKKQKFTVSSDQIEWVLTTTRGFPVASATIREPHFREFPEEVWWVMDINTIVTRPLQGRADRLQWLVDWSSLVRSMNGRIMCRQLEVTAVTLEEWAEIAPVLEDRLLLEGDWFIQE